MSFPNLHLPDDYDADKVDDRSAVSALTMFLSAALIFAAVLAFLLYRARAENTDLRTTIAIQAAEFEIRTRTPETTR